MRNIVFALLLSLAGSASWAREPWILRAGTVTFRVPDAWKIEVEGQRAEGRGPDGEGLIANYRVLKPGAPRDVVEHHVNTVRSFASEHMPGLATKNGVVVRPVAEIVSPEGRFQASSVSQGKQQGRDYYFLQYLLGSERLLLYVTVEGFGNALVAADRFEKILATQEWAE